LIASEELHIWLIVWEKLDAKICSFSLEISTYSRDTALDQCGTALSAAEPHASLFFCTCQLDLAKVSEFRSIVRFRTLNPIQQEFHFDEHCLTLVNTRK
jgi:hypothetical protein